MTRHSNGYRIWSGIIDSGVIGQGHVRQASACVWPQAAGFMPGGHASSLEDDEAREIVAWVVGLPDGLAIHPDHAERGFQWIERYGAKVGLPVGADVRELVREFRFVRCEYIDGHHARAYYAPTYRALFHDGRAFDYSPTPWTARAYDRVNGELSWDWVRQEVAA